jgi:hypothetical protein
MKKTFVNPEMNISLFEMENVLTESNNNAANTALEGAGVAGGNITTINASDINWIV